MVTEDIIFANLIAREEYSRRVIPHLKEEYFKTKEDKLIFNLISDYLNKYNSMPTKETLLIDLSSKLDVDEQVYDDAGEKIESLEAVSDNNLNWLVDSTEEFCKNRALYYSVFQAVDAIEGRESSFALGEIPERIQSALGISFDQTIGHDYFDDAEARFASYKESERRVPTNVAIIDTVTAGGWPEGSLNVFMGGVHSGKSLVMCSLAAKNLYAGKNVLYISMEMSEKQIGERIDAQLLHMTLPEMREADTDVLLRKMKKVHNGTRGKLIVQQYPTAGASVAHFRNLLNELRIKKNFAPDVIYVDYLNICMSARMKVGANVGMYQYVKSIAEELRGLAIEQKVPIISATQTNRAGMRNEDPGMEDVAESNGLSATCDSFFAIIATEDLREIGRIKIKQLKNRYRDFNIDNKFLLGIDYPIFKIYDINQDGAEDADDEVYVSPLPSAAEKTFDVMSALE